MTPFPWIDLLVIAGLVLISALFTMSELAIVSARPARLKMAAERGHQGAITALRLAADPGRFLSTVQFGITLVAIVAGAYSGDALGHPMAERLLAAGVPARYAEDAGFVLVIGLTTYFNLVIGELVPKQMALRHAEPIALLAARPVALVARVAAPCVWLLNRSSALVLRLFGKAPADEPDVTAEELHMIFAEATKSGVIEEEERALMTGIMRLAERPVREVMTPRTEIDAIDRRATELEVRAMLKESPHSLWPVTDGASDNIVGVVWVKDILATLLAGKRLQIARLMKKAEVVPDRLDAMDGLRILQQAEVAMALVHDEYGHLQGVVTPADLLSAIVGTFAGYQDEGEGSQVVEREDGSLLIAGSLPADVLADKLDLDLPDDRDYATAAGFALSVLKHLPKEGESFQVGGWRFEVVDMDGRKIDKFLVSRMEVEEE